MWELLRVHLFSVRAGMWGSGGILGTTSRSPSKLVLVKGIGFIMLYYGLHGRGSSGVRGSSFPCLTWVRFMLRW
jgi:hypothetical protein